jgi:hypothetical protein
MGLGILGLLGNVVVKRFFGVVVEETFQAIQARLCGSGLCLCGRGSCLSQSEFGYTCVLGGGVLLQGVDDATQREGLGSHFVILGREPQLPRRISQSRAIQRPATQVTIG